MDYKCEVCFKKFKNAENLASHMEKHSQEKIVKKKKDEKTITCNHAGCNLNFLSKGRKIIHHNKQEPECKDEKHSLIRLISMYKTSVLQLMSVQTSSDMVAKNTLKKDYESLVAGLYDNEYFVKVCSKHFEDMP